MKKTEIKNVLYVEDEPYYKKIYGAEIEKIGAKVTYVNNGEEAYNALKKGKFEVIIVDLIMPILSGIGFLKKIKKHKAHIIVLTTLEGNEDREDCRALGVKHFLVKTETSPKKLVKELMSL